MAQEIYDQMLAAGAPDLRKYDNDYFYRIGSMGDSGAISAYYYFGVRQHQPRWWNKKRVVQIGQDIDYIDINAESPFYKDNKQTYRETDVLEMAVAFAKKWASDYEDLLEARSKHSEFEQFVGDHP